MLDTLTTYQVGFSRKTRQDKTDNPKAEVTPPMQPVKEESKTQRKYQVKGETAKKQYKAKQSVVSLDYLENCL